MEKISVRNAGQYLCCLFFLDQYRASGAVGTGHYHGRRTAKVPVQQKMVHRRIGKHQSDSWADGRRRKCLRHRTGNRRLFFLFQQYNRPPGTGKEAFFLFPRLRYAKYLLYGSAHQCQRLGRTVLPPTQPQNRLRTGSVTGQMDASDSLDRHDSAAGQLLLGQCKGISLHPLPVSIYIINRRAAVRTAIRLGMVTAVSDILILLTAGGTHHKSAHCCLLPVIGQLSCNGITRPAVGTVDKRIPVSPIGRILKLPFARRTKGKVGRHQGSLLLFLAVPDFKTLITQKRRQETDIHGLHHGKRRRILPKLSQEAVTALTFPLKLRFHATGGILRPSGKPIGSRQTVQKGAKTHPLHDPPHTNAHSFLFHHPAITFRIFSDRNAASASMPSPVLLLTLKSGASGFTVS